MNDGFRIRFFIVKISMNIKQASRSMNKPQLNLVFGIYQSKNGILCEGDLSVFK